MTDAAVAPAKGNAHQVVAPRAAYFFTTVTHGPNELADACRVAGSIVPEASYAEAFMASAAVAYAGPLDPGISEASLLAPFPAGLFDGAMIVPPVRYFRDAFGATFLAHVRKTVRPGGWLLVPFHEDRVAMRTGYWNLDWLSRQLGGPAGVLARERMTLFRLAEPVPHPPSVLAGFLRDGHGFAVDFLTDRGQAHTEAYLRRCADFLLPPMTPVPDAEATFDGRINLAAEMEAFFVNMNYSVTGAGYKVQGLRRLIEGCLPRRPDLHVVDIGGGAGFVGIELLLTADSVARVVNCEPLAASLPLARRLYRSFEPWLRGRFKLCPSPAQDFPFAEPCDIVSAFASLLYIPRASLAATLDRAWGALRPGGLLVVHENIQRPCFAQKAYYGDMFTVEELEGYLSRFGPIEYYRSSDIGRMERHAVGDLTVFRVVRKD